MSELVDRLANGTHRVVVGRSESAGQAEELRAAIERKYLLVYFPETRGGTELGVPLDDSACRLDSADLVGMRGQVHVEGELALDSVPVRVIADLDLATREGHGRIEIVAATRAHV